MNSVDKLAYLNVVVSRRPEGDPVLLVDVRGLEVSVALPDDLVAGLVLLEEAHLDVVLDDLVAEEQHLLAAGDGGRVLGHPADRQVVLGLCK